MEKPPVPIVVLSALVLIATAGCAVIKVPAATGGSRADGTVQLSYEYGWLENPQVDLGAASVTATQRCRAWGYTQAEAFAPMSHCQETDSYGNCLRTLITTTYQCSGAP